MNAITKELLDKLNIDLDDLIDEAHETGTGSQYEWKSRIPLKSNYDEPITIHGLIGYDPRAHGWSVEYNGIRAEYPVDDDVIEVLQDGLYCMANNDRRTWWENASDEEKREALFLDDDEELPSSFEEADEQDDYEGLGPVVAMATDWLVAAVIEGLRDAEVEEDEDEDVEA